MRVFAAAITVMSFIAASPSLGQQQPAPASETSAPPYLGGTITYQMVLSDPPKAGSPLYAADDEVVTALQDVDNARYAAAQADATQLYPRFEAAFGRPINKDVSPALVHLLERAIADVNTVAFPAKDHFGRPRPFQRFHLRRACGLNNLPAPSPNASGGSSYPSGHSAWGWTTAMVLARVAPSHAEALMARAADYATSRLVCGVHYPSDVEAGHAVAAAVVAELDGNAEFRADLESARQELAGHR